ncbi:hypothetical protein ACFLTP_05905 [Chloroflexota bacterium]
MATLRTVRCPNCGQRSTGIDCQWCGNPLAKGRPVTEKEADQIIRETKEKVRKDSEAEQKSVQVVKQKEQTVSDAKDKAKKEAEEESSKIIAKARQKAEEEASKVVAKAKQKAEQIIEEAIAKAKKKAEEETTKIRKQAEQSARKLKETVEKETGDKAKETEQIIEEAKGKARREAEWIIKEARKRVPVSDEEIEGQAEEEGPVTLVTERQPEVSEVNAEAEVALSEEVGEFFQGRVKLGITSPMDFTQLTKFQEDLRQIPDLVLVSVGGSATGTEIIISVEKPISLVQVLKEMSPVKLVVNKGEKLQITLGSS